MRKAGIIGGLEFIGSYMTLKFLSENYQVKVPVSKFKNGKKILNIPGLSANKYLEEFHGDLNDLSETRKFVSDCDVIIHCGAPFRVNNLNEKPQLFVPEIKGAGPLLKILGDYPNIQKLIFISPPANIHPVTSSITDYEKNDSTTKNSMAKNRINLQFQKAVFHAKKAQENAYQILEEKRFEVIFVSPAEVSGNSMFSTRESTSAGLKYLFENEINHDPVFKRIIQQKKLQTLIKAENVAEEVFSKVNSTVKTEEEIYSTAG
ncbi:NAD-dependent epimerase/dehydratase family protein [Mariniphaga sp.]|uniref:NAD-dependent epimerase/dehydratase family protein n=1 Tax=Mariniphaga sp. TaxID=1954475 RepID=UPI0035656045